MNKKRIILGVFLLAIIVGSLLPKETKPPKTTRVILEHNEKTFIAPICFEESDPSNFLEETTLENAKDIGYKAHSQCTENALKGERDILIISLLKNLGLIETSWDH